MIAPAGCTDRYDRHGIEVVSNFQKYVAISDTVDAYHDEVFLL